jgi:hypothetical protein
VPLEKIVTAMSIMFLCTFVHAAFRMVASQMLDRSLSRHDSAIHPI